MQPTCNNSATGPTPGVITYRTDADYRADHPEADWPASWHRALCARLADEVPGLRIDYWRGPLRED